MASLRTITVFFLVTFVAAAALTGYLTFQATHAATVQLVDRRVDSVADAMLAGVEPGDADAILARIATLSRRRDTGDIGFELEDAAGRRLGGNVVLARPLPWGFSEIRAGDRIKGLSSGRAEMRRAGGGLRLITMIETEPIDGYAATRSCLYLLGFGAMAIIVVVGTLSLVLLVRRRVGEVRTTAQAIIDGDLQRRVPVSAGDGEFARQAAAFNHMLDRIAALMEQVRSVSGDVAHDLRTPLARLRGRLAMLARRVDAEDIRQELERALEQCDELLAMFAAVLRIAEVEGASRNAFRKLDLAALVDHACAGMEDVAAETRHRFTAGPLDPAWTCGDAQMLTQALLNLIDNGFRHTPPGSRVQVTVKTAGEKIELTVRDDGPGVPEQERALALRRFGRLDNSRSQPGHGLGLSLAEAVARLHGGTLTLADAAPGLTVTMSLPNVSPSAAQANEGARS